MSSTNEEKSILTSLVALFEANLPAAYNRPIPNFFQQNRVDALSYPNRLCMVDIGNTSNYTPYPDNLNTVSGGLSMKTVSFRIYAFSQVLDIDNVNIGTTSEVGVLDMEQEIYDVLNAQPFLNQPTLVMRWMITGVDREAWKAVEPLVGVTVNIGVEVGETDRINP